ncbi:MAG: hypothetical protein GX425_07400 [Peptococcaceae bacterium]|nr:hypothetical protein [Peptococcaceae bacterium]
MEIFENFIYRLALRLAIPRLRTFYQELYEMKNRSGYVRVRLDNLMVDILLILNGGSNDLRLIMGDKASEAWQLTQGIETKE